MDSREQLEYPLWKELARAVINRGALDYVLALKLLHGQSIPKTPLNYDVRAHPQGIVDDCETFFFSGWFRILSDDMGLDGMFLAAQIEDSWQEMYERAKKARSGRQVTEYDVEADRERIRRRERDYYQRNKERIRLARQARLAREGRKS